MTTPPALAAASGEGAGARAASSPRPLPDAAREAECRRWLEHLPARHITSSEWLAVPRDLLALLDAAREDAERLATMLDSVHDAHPSCASDIVAALVAHARLVHGGNGSRS